MFLGHLSCASGLLFFRVSLQKFSGKLFIIFPNIGVYLTVKAVLSCTVTLEKLDADFQCVHFLRWSEENFIFTTWICVDSDEDYEQAEMKGLFTLGWRLANRSHRQSLELVTHCRKTDQFDDISVVFVMYGDSYSKQIRHYCLMECLKIDLQFIVRFFSDMNITAKRNFSSGIIFKRLFRSICQFCFFHFDFVSTDGVSVLEIPELLKRIQSYNECKVFLLHWLLYNLNLMNEEVQASENAAAIDSARFARFISFLLYVYCPRFPCSTGCKLELISSLMLYRIACLRDSDSISYLSISSVRFLSFCKSLKLDYTHSNMNCLLLLLLLPAFFLLDQFIFIIESNMEL
ncbi:hypothetical protein T4C_9112 [Trichinella pseudospiralis]|uniref:Uncharacterized protein n=1 Tax=Trichinella pseudospiralis TaxID=6337 RepID=A0A0V1JJK0_TRIPS|nr:hypothetical protein T4C_9112 [Trichinella pseudospiralis]